MDRTARARAVTDAAPLAAHLSRELTWAGVLSNGVGALTVALFLAFLAPVTLGPDEYEGVLVRSGLVFVAYMAIALPLGRELVQRRPLVPITAWLRAERPATQAERLLVLRYPLNWALGTAIFWVIPAVLFSVLNASAGFAVAVSIAVTILLGGITACALQYLLVERLLRPVTVRALTGGSPPPRATPGIATRITMAWTLATAVPMLGVLAFAVADVAGADLGQGSVVGATIFLTLLAICVGLTAMLFAVRSVADPIVAVASALEAVEEGDLETQVPVADGSEVGILQAGFNRMITGLQERERLFKAFGAFVDPELTERVLEHGTDLAGEEVGVTVMFVDVRGFTGFAERSEAREVVARLNDLFDVIVPIVLRNGGHASKFIGDGLLAVFGAPERLRDHADRAVAAAKEIAASVRARYGDELRIGVGVNSGPVVAGTVGGGGRLDFTVIGDAVNTAARVEAATRETDDDILITEATRALMSRDREDWEPRRAIRLKGKSGEIELYAPAVGGGDGPFRASRSAPGS
ncbi:MAG: adenylate/guanylate cyclase domain-containing protein [Solirubrobacterales bacterium]